jgi:hypothetical protein
MNPEIAIMWAYFIMLLISCILDDYDPCIWADMWINLMYIVTSVGKW